MGKRKGNDFEALDMVFLSVGVFLERMADKEQDYAMKRDLQDVSEPEQ